MLPQFVALGWVICPTFHTYPRADLWICLLLKGLFGSWGSWHLSTDYPTGLRKITQCLTELGEWCPIRGGWWKTMWDCLPTTSSSHPFVKMSLQSCCICVCCEASTIAIVYSPVCCGCSMCTELARAEISILKSFFWVLGGWFSGTKIYVPPSINLCLMLMDLTAQPGMMGMGIAHGAASSLSPRINGYLEVEGWGQRSTGQKGCMWRILAYSTNLSNNKPLQTPSVPWKCLNSKSRIKKLLISLGRKKGRKGGRKEAERERREGGKGKGRVWWFSDISSWVD